MLTQNDVIRFKTEMVRRTSFRIVGKSEVTFLESLAARRLPRAAKVLDGFEELRRPCCLSLFGKTVIFLTFDVGCKEIDYMTQIETITHECQHGFDIRDYVKTTGKNDRNWLRNYFADQHFRMWAEGPPSTAGAEVAYHLTDKYPGVEASASAYFVTDMSAVRLFTEGTEARKTAALQTGRAMTRAGTLAIEVLKGMGF